MSRRIFTLSELAQRLGVAFEGDPSLALSGVATLDEAGEGDLSFLANPKYKEALGRTRAGAVILSPAEKREGRAQLITPQPYLIFARAVQLFHPPEHPGGGVHPGAFVSPGAALGAGTTVMAGATVEEGAAVGENCVLYPGAYVGRGAQVGRDCVLYPNVTVREGCVLGDRVILQPGCVIGSDGFGYAPGPSGHEKIPQVGIVRLGDDVEVGACAAIDRAALGETRVGRGTKIDNLVQVGHNVTIGEHCFIISQVGISGSVKIGNRVILAGQVGVAGHLKIGDGAIIGAQSGIPSDVAPGAVLSGSPVTDHRDWIKSQLTLKKLPQMRHDLMAMQKRLDALERAQAAHARETTEKGT